MKRNISELVNKYEEGLTSGKSIYLDADQFEELAEYYDQEENFDQAAQVIDAGLRIHPESRPLLLRRARILVYEGEYSKALQLLNITFNEYDFDLYLLKIECLLQMGLQAEAYLLTKEILENENDFIDNALAELGFIYLDADLFKEAALYFNKSLEYNDQNIDVMNDLAYTYEMLGDFNKAIENYNKVLDIDSYSYTAWVNIGRLYSINEELEKAVDAFDFALTINDSDIDVLKLKAHCLSLSGRAEEASIIFKDLLDLTPNDSSIYFLLAECYCSLYFYDEALDYLNKYQELEGNSLEVLLKKVSIYIDREEYDIALNMLLESYEDYQNSADVNLFIGEIKYKQELLEEAETYYLKAYMQNDNNTQVVDRLAVINIKNGNYSEALKYTNILLDLEPYSVAAKQRMALLYFELDNSKEFENLLDTFSDGELYSLFNLIYDKDQYDGLNRELLIKFLKEARECRILFKYLKH